MAKAKAGKSRSDKKLADDYRRILHDFELDELQLTRRSAQTTGGDVIVVRDYVTYSAYEDPIEG